MGQSVRVQKPGYRTGEVSFLSTCFSLVMSHGHFVFHAAMSGPFGFPGSISEGEEQRQREEGPVEKSLLFYQVGFMKDGKIVALEVDHFSNCGNTRDLSESVSRTYTCTQEQRGVQGRAPQPGDLLDSCLDVCLLLFQ